MVPKDTTSCVNFTFLFPDAALLQVLSLFRLLFFLLKRLTNTAKIDLEIDYESWVGFNWLRIGSSIRLF